MIITNELVLLTHTSITSNPNILLIAPEHGGHVGFVAAKKNGDFDRLWMENRVVEFCSLINEKI
jgi:predicted alpha/beta-fold hydrolase